MQWKNFTQNLKVLNSSPLFILVHFKCRMFMNFWKKNWEVKREKTIILFVNSTLNMEMILLRYIYIYIYIYNLYIYIYIYTYNNNNNAFIFIYIKKVYAFSIKLSATTKELIRSNSICCWKNPAIFFTE